MAGPKSTTDRFKTSRLSRSATAPDRIQKPHAARGGLVRVETCTHKYVVGTEPISVALLANSPITAFILPCSDILFAAVGHASRFPAGKDKDVQSAHRWTHTTAYHQPLSSEPTDVSSSNYPGTGWPEKEGTSLRPRPDRVPEFHPTRHLGLPYEMSSRPCRLTHTLRARRRICATQRSGCARFLRPCPCSPFVRA